MQIIIIKFLTTESIKPSEILRRLQAQFPGIQTSQYGVAKEGKTHLSRAKLGWKDSCNYIF